MFKVKFYLNAVTGNSEDMEQVHYTRNYEGFDNAGQLANHIGAESAFLEGNTFLMAASGKHFFKANTVTDFYIEEIKED